MVKSIKNDPSRFIGLKTARLGFVAAIMATAMVGTLIGITIPERWQRHQWAIEAGINARGYTLSRALLEYRELHGTLPANDELVKDLSTLADPDGSIAEALRGLDVSGYQASSVLAAASNKGKPPAMRGGALRGTNTSADSATDRGVSFNKYELRLPGEDNVLNNDDDVIVRDGVILKVTDLPPSRRPSAPSRSTAP